MSARIPIDARSDEGAKEIYGGIYPTSVLYATQSYIDENPETIQKVYECEPSQCWNGWHNDSAEEIVEKLPKEFISGDRETYVKAVQNAKPIFSVGGKFNDTDVQTPLAVLKSFNEKVANTTIDLSKTYTNDFVNKVTGKTTN